MATYTALRNTAKSFDGEWRKYPGGSRDAGGANLVIKSVPDNLKTLTVTITASPNENGDGGLYKVSLRRNGVDLAQLNTSKTNTTQFSYTFQKADIFAGQEFDIRYWNNEGGWDSEDPADYYRQESEDSATLAAYTGNTKLGDGKCTISLSESATFEEGSTPPAPAPTGCCPPPPPWPTFTCGDPPSLISVPGGMQISKTGEKQITLSLRNYADKLVTLRITHEVRSGVQWTQSFSFNIPNCSDISPDTGGQPYSKGAYSNPNISGTNVITLYNLDGGHDYVFDCDSIAGPRPTRRNCFETSAQSCSTSGDPPVETCVPICVPNFYTEEYPGTWPPCPVGVAIALNGGTRVRWYYEDGGGTPHGDQIVTIELIEANTRNIVPRSGTICTTTLKSNVWNGSPSDASANCLLDYILGYNNKIRYRLPASKTSKTVFTPGTKGYCFSDFRGIAGAREPANITNTSGNQYSILHVISEQFEYDLATQLNVPVNKTTSFVYSAGITASIAPVNAEKTLYSEVKAFNANTFDEADPHYVITSDLITNKEGVIINTGQNITADGIQVTSPGVISIKKKVDGDQLKVWFHIDAPQSPSFRGDTLLHNATGITSSQGITVTSGGTKAKTDAGTINNDETYHYVIEFNDQESVNLLQDPDTNIVADFIITVLQQKNQTGSTIPVSGVVTREKEGSTLKIWFTTQGADGPENTYVRQWKIERTVEVLRRNYTFMRNWYITAAL